MTTTSEAVKFVALSLRVKVSVAVSAEPRRESLVAIEIVGTTVSITKTPEGLTRAPEVLSALPALSLKVAPLVLNAETLRSEELAEVLEGTV